MLEQQKIDLGLVAEPRTSKGLVFLPVMDIEDIFAASPSYLENFRLREGDQADVFQSGNVMLLDRTNITRHYMDEYMALNQIEANNLLEVTTMDLLIEFVRIGLGVGSVIKEFIKDDLETGKLVQLKLDVPIHKRTVGFAYYPNRTSKALETFIDFCRSRKS